MTDPDYILFESYTSKTLTEMESMAFENRLQNDAEFKQAFETYSEVSGFLAHKFEHEEKRTTFQNNLKNIGNTYFNGQETAKKIIKFKPWQYAMAASVVLFVGVFSYNLFSTPTYGDYVSHETISFAIRGTQNELLQNAENAFNDKNFTDAETYFTQLIQTEPTTKNFNYTKLFQQLN